MLICIKKFEIRELFVCIKKSIEISRFDFIYFKNANVYRDKSYIVKIKDEERDSVDVDFKISICLSIVNI